jgi:hypothetical protein
MCVVIVDGKVDDLLIQMGIDEDCEQYYPNLEKGENKYDYLLKNLGTGHQYPCGKQPMAARLIIGRKTHT